MRLMHVPPLPELPEFLRGRSIAVIDGAYAGGAARARPRSPRCARSGPSSTRGACSRPPR